MIKKNWLLAACLAGIFIGAKAAEFNPLVGNPFVFCSAPRPCKYCQPFRRIYSEICDSQNKAKNSADLSNAETPQELDARNKALTSAQLSESRQSGANALAAAIQRGNVIPLDENTPDLNFNAFAAGWNSELAKRQGASAR